MTLDIIKTQSVISNMGINAITADKLDYNSRQTVLRRTLNVLNKKEGD